MRFLLLSPAVNGRWPGQDVLGRVGDAGVVAAGDVEESIEGGILAVTIMLGQECCRGGQLLCPRVVRRARPSVAAVSVGTESPFAAYAVQAAWAATHHRRRGGFSLQSRRRDDRRTPTFT